MRWSPLEIRFLRAVDVRRSVIIRISIQESSGRPSSMSKIVLEKINLRHSEDWYGNNAAVSCPLCSKTFIVSAFLNKGRRECPSCGRSFAHIDGGSIIIEWIEQEKFPVMSRAELEKRNRLKEFVALVQSGGAVNKSSIEHNLPSAQSIAFIEQNGSMVAAAAKKEPRPHYAERSPGTAVMNCLLAFQ